MTELREVFEMATKQMEPDQDSWKDQERRQRRRTRNRRIGAYAAVAVILVAAAAFALSQMKDKSSTPVNTGPGGGPQRVTQALIVGVDGTTRPLNGIPANADSLNISPDGRSIVFVAVNNGSPQIGTIAVDGSRMRFITQVASVTTPGTGQKGPLTPVWSPDGSRIAFANRQIYVVNADGSGLRKLTSDAGVDQWPAWAPDGSTIVYSNSGATPLDNSGFSDTQDIWSVPANGGTPTPLTRGSGSDDMPAYSPDGSRIAFFNNGEILLMDANGHNVRPLNGRPHGFNPRWSPDGSRLVYVSCCAGHRALNDLPLLRVNVVNLSTGSVSRIPGLVASDVNAVQWLPTGNALIENRYIG